MQGPRELLRRAAQNRNSALPQPAREEPPAPRQPSVLSHHANYTALMHSHDRMRTRHLPEQGGGKRA